MPTSYGGCFAVKKESIRKYDKDFYLKILEILSKNKTQLKVIIWKDFGAICLQKINYIYKLLEMSCAQRLKIYFD